MIGDRLCVHDKQGEAARQLGCGRLSQWHLDGLVGHRIDEKLIYINVISNWGAAIRVIETFIII